MLKKFVLKFYFACTISAAQHLYEKREGSGAGSGSIPLTDGSGIGSVRPKNMRIRIPNTATRGEERPWERNGG